ncbi:hypothetical protein AB0D10_25765 [Kitasatospora sp. NPDC048545]|uniref:hypothetical protein n=1 Tax=Kitasatospora sp. NPDC048545 TaxID=3157208 RepID=UPI0033E0FE72
MSDDQSSRPARLPLTQPFSHRDAAVDQPYGERLVPVQHLDSPFATPAVDDVQTASVGPQGRRTPEPETLDARTTA